MTSFAQDASPNPTSAIFTCGSIEEDMARLACYDEAVSRLERAEHRGETTTVSEDSLREIKRESFSFENPPLAETLNTTLGNPDDVAITDVEFVVASVQRLPYKNLRVTMQNGQVWEQTDSSRVYYSKKRGVEMAIIKRASLGSFKMKLNGGRAFRVKRVK